MQVNKNALATLENKRKSSIEFYAAGEKISAIAKKVGLSRPSVKKAVALYEEKGIDGLSPSPRGRQKGNGRVLTPEQENKIKSIMISASPNEYYNDERLNLLPVLNQKAWNKHAVQLLIKQLFDIELSASGVNKYLYSWGFITPYLNNLDNITRPTQISKWIEKTYPELFKRFRLRTSDLYLINRTRIPDGEEKGWIIHIVDHQGKQYWFVLRGLYTLNKQKIILRMFLSSKGKKTFIVPLDEALFSEQKIKSYLKNRTSKLEVFFPDEQRQNP